jgi:UDP-glucose 4-epimerase
MNIVVTGSAGFVGKTLVAKLKQQEYRVIEIDFNTGYDITQWKSVSSVKDFQVLIHLAARTFVPDSYTLPREFYHDNIIGTLNALELCRFHQAKMIFASSYVYGKPEYLPIDEQHPVRAHNPYAQSKILAEQLCERYNIDFKVPVVILRPFNIYGPGQNGNFLIPSIIKQAREGKIVLKDAKPKRDFVFIDDVVDAYIKAIEYKTEHCECFNIASGQSYSVEEVSKIIKKIGFPLVKICYDQTKRRDEVQDTQAQITKIQTCFDWTPAHSLIAGLHSCINNFEEL